jgi:hypothetical protein
MMSDPKNENPLLDEMLTEVAETFFGARKEVDDMRTLLDEHLQGLRAKESAIRRQLAFLAYLLVDPPTTADFFRMLEVEAEPLGALPCAAADAPAEPLPFGWRRKSQYVKLVLRAYAQLHLLLNDYQNGTFSDARPGPEAPSPRQAAYCKLVLELAKLINAKISELNRNMPPSGTLRFVKQFDAQMQLKDFVAGSNIADYTRTIDAKLRLPSIDLDSLPIVDFPSLPAPDIAAARIEAYCRKTFKAHKAVLVSRLGELARLSRLSCKEPET